MDQHEKGHIKIKYCPTEEMTADYMSKLLTGAKFKKFRKEIMNLPLLMTSQLMMWCFIAKAKPE